MTVAGGGGPLASSALRPVMPRPASVSLSRSSRSPLPPDAAEGYFALVVLAALVAWRGVLLSGSVVVAEHCRGLLARAL